jgi:serine O-acetyltransferase
MITNEYIRKQYVALKKCVLNDFCYPLEWDDATIEPIFEEVAIDLIRQHSQIKNTYYRKENGKGGFDGLLNLAYLDHYVILGFRLARKLSDSGLKDLAEAVFYSYRMRGDFDMYYKADVGDYFKPSHAIGTCLDNHVKYGKLFQVYNKVHVGPFNIVGKDPKDWTHPIIGDYVTVLAGSNIYGKTIIGDNVIVAVGTTIINAEVPDNCVVSGQSPNLFFMPLKKTNKDQFLDV